MELLIVGDCHGKPPEIEGDVFDVVLATGDICGDSEKVQDLMFESMDSEEQWYEMMGHEEAREHVEQSIQEGHEVLKKLSATGREVYVVPGNWDWTGEIYDGWSYLQENRFQSLVDEFDNLHNLNYRREKINGVDIIGYGPCSGPELPQYADDEPDTEEEMQQLREDYREKKERLQQLFEKASGKVVFLSHNVPHGTDLDEIKNEESPVNGRHYGSVIVRELVDEHQPSLSVAGHMHEGYGSVEIGETVAVNAGLEAHVVAEMGENVSLEFHPLIEDY